jgi:hypothetical protein
MSAAAANDVSAAKRPRSLSNSEPGASSAEFSLRGPPVAFESIHRAESANLDLTKRPRNNPRAWSLVLDDTDRCSIYTIRAFLGDPEEPLPAYVKAMKKNDLKTMMQRSGYSDVLGDKNALLHRFQTGIPWLEYRIDGRECLQRMLVVCLDSRGYDDAHLFQATMPARGDCPWGKKRLGDLDCLMDTMDLGGQQAFVRPLHSEQERNKWINRKLASRHVDRATLEALLDRRLSLNDFAPFRTVDGTGFEPGPVGKGFDPDFSNDVGGAISLNECCLAAGDRISMKYDFGDTSCIIFKIIKLDVNQQALPETAVLRQHATRACVDQRGGASVIRQYGQGQR